MTPTPLCILCDQPAVAELHVAHAASGKYVCGPCLLALTAKKFRAQDTRVARNMATHQARVRGLVGAGVDVARDGGEW